MGPAPTPPPSTSSSRIGADLAPKLSGCQLPISTAKSSYTVTVTATDNSVHASRRTISASIVTDAGVTLVSVRIEPVPLARRSGRPTVSAVSRNDVIRQPVGQLATAPANAGKPAIAKLRRAVPRASPPGWTDGQQDVTGQRQHDNHCNVRDLSCADTLYDFAGDNRLQRWTGILTAGGDPMPPGLRIPDQSIARPSWTTPRCSTIGDARAAKSRRTPPRAWTVGKPRLTAKCVSA